MSNARIAMLVLVSTTMAVCFTGCSRGEPTMEIAPFKMRYYSNNTSISARNIVLSSNCKRAATVGGLLDVTVFDTQTRTAVWSRRFDDGQPDFIAFVRDSIGFARDSSLPTYTDDSVVVAAWRDSGKRTPGSHDRTTIEAPDDRSCRAVVRWLNADDGHELDIARLPAEERPISLSPDGRLLIALRDETAICYDVESMKPIGSPIEHAKDCIFSVSGDCYAVTTKRDDRAATATVETACDETDYNVVICSTFGKKTVRIPAKLLSWIIGLDHKAIYTRDWDGNVRAVALDGKTPPRYVTRNSLAFALLPDGERFAVLHQDGTLAICSLETGEQLHWCVLPTSTRELYWKLAAGSDGTIAIASDPDFRRWPSIVRPPSYPPFVGFAKMLPKIAK